jgi:hypothetical protein
MADTATLVDLQGKPIIRIVRSCEFLDEVF